MSSLFTGNVTYCFSSLQFKRAPIDYKVHDDENFIEAERKKTCAINIYLLEVYLNFADGIIEDDFDLVRGEID